MNKSSIKAIRPLLLLFVVTANVFVIAAALSLLSATDTATAQSGNRVYLPIVFKNYKTPPPFTTSLYVQKITTSQGNPPLYDEGCSRAGQSGVVILDFGQPWRESGFYGSRLISATTFLSTTTIVEATKDFLRGYWICSSNKPPSHLKVVIGVNNFGSYTGAGHGQAWAQVVNDIDAFINISPTWESRLSAVGGTDAEMNFNTPSATRAWVNAYVAATTCVPGGGTAGCLYNFGNALCPESGEGACGNTWTQSDVVYISWAVKKASGDTYTMARALPQIYNTRGANARQWKNLSVYSVNHGTGKMYFVGSLTNRQACTSNVPRNCTGLDNTPETGWAQLYGELNFDSAGNPDTRTAQELPWSSDIKYQGEWQIRP